MKKLIASLAIMVSISVSAQTLFYYGNDSVSVNEFLTAYHKNNTGPKNEKAFLDYLHLYIASRLKIKEARERGYDTITQIVSDLENLRQQILPSYLNDKESVNRLTDEALLRSKKDIHLEHIFVSFVQNEIYDTVAAAKKLDAVLKKLSATGNFSQVAKEYSDDPSAKANGGDLGYITVFILPYELENIAYSLSVGKVSAAYRSKAGYHIFKNVGERRNLGRMKAAQILFAFPPHADDATKAHIKKLADSIYNRIQKGDDFAKLASQFSNDAGSASANGQMPDFGAGQYDEVFEKNAFAIPQDNGVSKPFLTSYGYHIVKRLSRLPAYSIEDKKAMETLKSKVAQSDRMKTAASALAGKVLRNGSYKKMSFNNSELWAYTDSILNYTKPKTPLTLKGDSPLFKIGSKEFTVSDWIIYAQTFRYKSDGSGTKIYPQLWEEYLDASAVNYYQAHLEDFNDDFRRQINEFKEGNLFFEIMQRQVWSPAQTDSAALLNYFEKNRSSYNWIKSVDAVIFYTSDPATAKIFVAQLKRSPASWRKLVANYSEKIAADSSRFELSQIPNPSKKQMVIRPGIITEPLVNKSDNTTSFAYILRMHDKPEPRNFSEAKGLVINDYQNKLEKDWISQLEKKYPVHINQKLLDEIVRTKKF